MTTQTQSREQTQAPQQAPNRGAMTVQPPSRAASMKLSECRTVEQALQTNDMASRIRAALPKHVSAERMLRVLALAVYKTPELRNCELMSLVGAMLVSASLGLEPNTPLGHAYLIPFNQNRKDKETGKWETTTVVQYIIGYRGFVDLARRSGHVVSMHADVVYDGDDFSFEYGSNQHLRHVPLANRRDARPTHAYCHVKMTDGEAFEVLPYNEVLNIRNSSAGYQQALKAKANRGDDTPAYSKNPWVAFEHEMAAKTMVRRVSKMLPLSIEYMNANQLDLASDAGAADLARIAVAADTHQALDRGDYEIDQDGVVQDQAPTSPPPPPAAQDKSPEPATPPRQRKARTAAPQEQASPQNAPPQGHDNADLPGASQDGDAMAGGDPANETPAGDPPAYELTDCDGNNLTYTQDEGQQAFKDFNTALKDAHGRGKSALDGFIETNAELIAAFKASGFAIPPAAQTTAPKAQAAQQSTPRTDLF